MGTGCHDWSYPSLEEVRFLPHSPSKIRQMTINLKLCWKVFHRLPDSAPQYTVGESTDLFEVRTGKSILRDVGGNIDSTFFPLVLEPKSPLFSKLSSTARRVGLRGSKLEFEGQLPTAFVVADQLLRCRFGLHIYGRHACITVDCQSFAVPENIDLRKLQDLSSFPMLQVMVKKLMELLTTKANKTFPVPGDFKVYPCLQLAPTADARRQFSDVELAEVVTRHYRIRKSAAEDVLAKNLGHQVDGTTTLLDRQGVLSYIPPSAHADEVEGSNRRFRSCVAIIELAAAAHRLHKDQASMPSSTIESLRLLISNPRLTIPNSTSAQRAWSLLVDEFNLVGSYSNLQVEVKAFKPTMQDIEVVASKVRDEIEDDRVIHSRLSSSGIRILCIAAATVELSTVSEQLAELFGEGEIAELDDGHEFALQFTNPEKSITWYVVPLSFQGQVDAAVSVKTLCNLLKPTLALMVGMCMSMPGKGLPPGTVVIPNEVTVFDHERLTTEGVQHRPHGDRVDNGLFKLAKIVASTRKFEFKVITDKGLASATSKVENVKSELVQFIEKSFPDAAVFDMEGWGFYRAGAGQLCLWIKAVADTGEAQGASHTGQLQKLITQAEVTKNAVNFSIALVNSFIKVKKLA